MGTTVLIVDDHRDFRAFARALLEAGGFEVVGEAVDGASALVAARALKPALVLLDVQLPDIDRSRRGDRRHQDAPDTHRRGARGSAGDPLVASRREGVSLSV
jgi:CheY-like chemotaxis protein